MSDPEITPEVTEIPVVVTEVTELPVEMIYTTICHVTGKHYQVLTLPAEALNGHFDDNGLPLPGHADDFIIEDPSDTSACTPPNEPPAVTHPGDQQSIAGQSVILPIVASDPENQPLQFVAEGLPAALALDPVTGIISGRLGWYAASLSPYNVLVRVTDRSGLSGITHFLWIVTEPQWVTICHMSGPEHNRHYQVMTLAFEALGGHFDEQGLPKQGHERDFIVDDPASCGPSAG